MYFWNPGTITNQKNTAPIDFLEKKPKRLGEISGIIMFNQNLYQNKSYYMNLNI